jgi:hypothetical protein
MSAQNEKVLKGERNRTPAPITFVFSLSLAAGFRQPVAEHLDEGGGCGV